MISSHLREFFSPPLIEKPSIRLALLSSFELIIVFSEFAATLLTPASEELPRGILIESKDSFVVCCTLMNRVGVVGTCKPIMLPSKEFV